MQDAGAARNQRTSNGPSGTPAPTECMTGATAEQPRAVGDAGPYGGIDESTPVLGGAPMRAVRDAGPYGCATGDVAEQPAGGTEPRLYRVVQA